MGRHPGRDIVSTAAMHRRWRIWVTSAGLTVRAPCPILLISYQIRVPRSRRSSVLGRSHAPQATVGCCPDSVRSMSDAAAGVHRGAWRGGWPLAAHGQQTPMPVIGYLSSESREGRPELIAAFHRGLAEVGYVAGRDAAIDSRWANGKTTASPHWPPIWCAVKWG